MPLLPTECITASCVVRPSVAIPPNAPWSRIHIDHAGLFMGKTFLVVVDAYSKWINARVVPSTSSDATLQVLKSIFSYLGLPEQIVSDNATRFTSIEFQKFCSINGIKHVRTAAYHPRSNGQVERAVRLVKDGSKKNRKSKSPLQCRLDKILFAYRTTPHATTCVAPCELLMKRSLVTALHLMMPDVAKTVRSLSQPSNEPRSIAPNSQVNVKDIVHDCWCPATVIRQTGPLSYRLMLPSGRIVDRHVDHIREIPCSEESSTQLSSPEDDSTADTNDDREEPTTTGIILQVKPRDTGLAGQGRRLTTTDMLLDND